MTVAAEARHKHSFTLAQYFICLKGIVWREALRFIHQRERFVSALVRPLVWLFIFAAGFRQVLGVSIIPPYETYVLYEVYIAPGLIAMIQLFNGMQSSLTMVYDRETGGMRTLLVSPFPRWWLLTSKLLAGTLVSIVLILRRGPSSIAGLSLITIAASLLVVTLSSRVSSNRWSPLVGKWLLITAAALNAAPLVVSASGR